MRRRFLVCSRPLPRASRLYALAPLVLAVLAGCSAELVLPEGLACDLQHPCLEGRVCGEDGRCRPFADSGDAGSGDGGSGDAGSDGGTEEIALRWNQAKQGFVDEDNCSTGCDTVIERAEGNRLTARIPVAAGAYAYAYPSETSLPRGPVGRLRGRVRVPPTAEFQKPVVILDIESELGPSLLRLVVGSGGALGLDSGARTLTWEAYVVSDTGARLEQGSTHLVEVAFRQGSFVRLWLDDVLVLDATLPAHSESKGKPKDLWFGLGAAEAGGTPLELVFHDWKISDTAELPLTD